DRGESTAKAGPLRLGKPALVIGSESCAAGEMPEDVFDHDHAGADDQAEIDRSDRQQICRFTAQHHDADREGECEGNSGGDDEGAAKIAEENQLNDENEGQAEEQI